MYNHQSMEDECILARIGKNIKELRMAHGWSQEKLAELSRVDRSFLGKVERGVVNVSILTLCDIVKALGSNIKNII